MTKQYETLSDTELKPGDIIERYHLSSFEEDSEVWMSSSDPYKLRVTKCLPRPDRYRVWHVWGEIMWGGD